MRNFGLKLQLQKHNQLQVQLFTGEPYKNWFSINFVGRNISFGAKDRSKDQAQRENQLISH